MDKKTIIARVAVFILYLIGAFLIFTLPESNRAVWICGVVIFGLLIETRWVKKKEDRDTVNDILGVACMISVFALLYWSPKDWGGLFLIPIFLFIIIANIRKYRRKAKRG